MSPVVVELNTPARHTYKKKLLVWLEYNWIANPRVTQNKEKLSRKGKLEADFKRSQRSREMGKICTKERVGLGGGGMKETNGYLGLSSLVLVLRTSWM